MEFIHPERLWLLSLLLIPIIIHLFHFRRQKVLYFSSDMPGGTGGMDIYKCTFDNGKFGQKELVRFVNTDKNDIFPIVYKNKLYFTSQGHKSVGGYDLFVMENFEINSLGAPFNSVNDDLAIFFTDDKNGYITSNRGTAGATDDIYAFNLKEKFVDLPLDYVVTDAQTGEPIGDVAIRIIDDSTGIVLFEGVTSDVGLLTQMFDSIPLQTKMRLKIVMDKEGYISKEIAFDLIKLYAQRKAQTGFAFTPDNYMMHELEASFIYEDTIDQAKAIADVKKDMEATLN